MKTEIMKNYYELLGIDKNVASSEIRKKYLQTKFGSNYSSMTSEDRNLLEKAYNTLSDEVRRIKYNQTLSDDTIDTQIEEYVEPKKSLKPLLIYSSFKTSKYKINPIKSNGRIIDVKTGTTLFSERYGNILDNKINTLLGEPGNSYVLSTLKTRYQNQIDLLANNMDVRMSKLKNKYDSSSTRLENMAYIMGLQKLNRNYSKVSEQIDEYDSYKPNKVI